MNDINPFNDDLDLLEHEIAWVAMRSKRLAAIKEQAEDQRSTRQRSPTWGSANNTAEVQIPADLDAALAEDQTLRATIDARIRATEASGATLGLRVLVQRHDLDEADRNTMLLCLVPCVGSRATDPLERIGGYGLPGCISAEVVARFCELSVRERLSRHRFDSSHKLIAAGLMQGDLDDDASPGEWPTNSIKLTNKGFTALTGIATRPALGQAEDHRTPALASAAEP